jgi:tetratricopeptide (TPR) repeat protein
VTTPAVAPAAKTPVVVVATPTPMAMPAATSEMHAALAASYQAEQAGNYKKALAAMQHLPRMYFIDLRLGWLYYLNGNYSEADTHYEAAIKASPAAIEAKIGYTLPLLAQKRYKAVEQAALEIALIDRNNYTANLRLAYALRMQQQYASAEEILTRMLTLYPTDGKLLTEHGLNLVALHQQTAARQIFDNITLIDPTNALAKEQLGKR